MISVSLLIPKRLELVSLVSAHMSDSAFIVQCSFELFVVSFASVHGLHEIRQYFVLEEKNHRVKKLEFEQEQQQ